MSIDIGDVRFRLLSNGNLSGRHSLSHLDLPFPLGQANIYFDISNMHGTPINVVRISAEVSMHTKAEGILDSPFGQIVTLIPDRIFPSAEQTEIYYELLRRLVEDSSLGKFRFAVAGDAAGWHEAGGMELSSQISISSDRSRGGAMYFDRTGSCSFEINLDPIVLEGNREATAALLADDVAVIATILKHAIMQIAEHAPEAKRELERRSLVMNVGSIPINRGDAHDVSGAIRPASLDNPAKHAEMHLSGWNVAMKEAIAAHYWRTHKIGYQQDAVNKLVHGLKGFLEGNVADALDGLREVNVVLVVGSRRDPLDLELSKSISELLYEVSSATARKQQLEIAHKIRQVVKSVDDEGMQARAAGLLRDVRRDMTRGRQRLR